MLLLGEQGSNAFSEAFRAYRHIIRIHQYIITIVNISQEILFRKIVKKYCENQLTIGTAKIIYRDPGNWQHMFVSLHFTILVKINDAV